MPLTHPSISGLFPPWGQVDKISLPSVSLKQKQFSSYLFLNGRYSVSALWTVGGNVTDVFLDLDILPQIHPIGKPAKTNRQKWNSKMLETREMPIAKGQFCTSLSGLIKQALQVLGLMLKINGYVKKVSWHSMYRMIPCVQKETHITHTRLGYTQTFLPLKSEKGDQRTLKSLTFLPWA